jgi:hypothetical protein
MADDMAERELARTVLASVGLELVQDVVPTAEAEMQRLARQADEAAEAAVRPVSMPAPSVAQKSYAHLNTGQKLELVLSRLDHIEQLAVMLHSKVDRVGMNTVNLSKNNQHIAAMLQALVDVLTDKEPEQGLIQTVGLGGSF